LPVLGDRVEVALQRDGVVVGRGVADADRNAPEVGGEFGRVGIVGIEPALPRLGCYPWSLMKRWIHP